MAGLEGTFQTPLGAIPKKTVLYVAGGGALVIGIVWWRTRGQSSELAGQSEINPATGYPYGSVEDAQAMAAQASYVSPTDVTPSPGGSASYPPGGAFVSNGQWSQTVIQYMTDSGIIENPAPLSEALGRYILGQPLTSTQISLVQQAIATQGFPPVAGPNGYPPAINTTPTPVTPVPTPTPTPTPAPTPKPPVVSGGYHAVTPWPTRDSTIIGLTEHYRTNPSYNWGHTWYHTKNARIRELRKEPRYIRTGDMIWVP